MHVNTSFYRSGRSLRPTCDKYGRDHDVINMSATFGRERTPLPYVPGTELRVRVSRSASRRGVRSGPG